MTTHDDDFTQARGYASLDPDHALRAAVAGVVTELALEGSPALKASFARLLGTMNVRPAPELRLCPVCGTACMRAATLCGHCWSKLGEPHPAGARP